MNNNFNPRPPRGGRRVQGVSVMSFFIFQSTPPARGATMDFFGTILDMVISIHAPREGGDRKDV